MPPGSKAVLTGVPHGMNMEPMEARLQSRHSPVDPYVCSHPSNKVGPLGGWVLSSKMSLNPYLLNVQGARYPTAGLQYNLSTCDPNQLKPTSSHWQSMAIQTMAIHVWPGQSTSSQYHQRSSKPKIISRWWGCQEKVLHHLVSRLLSSCCCDNEPAFARSSSIRNVKSNLFIRPYCYTNMLRVAFWSNLSKDRNNKCV